MSPEEVCMSVRVTGDRSNLPCKWLKMELPPLLDQIRTLAAASAKITAEQAVSISLRTLLQVTVKKKISELNVDVYLVKKTQPESITVMVDCGNDVTSSHPEPVLRSSSGSREKGGVRRRRGQPVQS